MAKRHWRRTVRPKISWGMALCLLPVVACGNADPQVAGPPQATLPTLSVDAAPSLVVRSFILALNGHDAAAIRRLATPDEDYNLVHPRNALSGMLRSIAAVSVPATWQPLSPSGTPAAGFDEAVRAFVTIDLKLKPGSKLTSGTQTWLFILARTYGNSNYAKYG